jgi:GH15 family glucan-1,4-alpha-glucosidase
MQRLLEVSNDVGLLAEEYDPRNRRFIGNFPQAFSHLTLVGAANQLRRAEAKAKSARRSTRPEGAGGSWA